MKLKTGLVIVLLSVVVLSVFGREDDSKLSSTELIMTKADATAYWDSLSAE